MGQALALKRSFLKHNPGFKFYVILVDKLSKQIDYKEFDPATIVPMAQVDGLDIDDLIARYYIIELNTSIKPSVFKYLKKQHPEVAAMYYLDPDLYFYDSLEETNTLLQSKTAVLTPHILSPIERDGLMPDENVFLRFGIYNLGFIGVNMQSKQALDMLDWWEERNLKFGYDRPQKGYFVDQLWMAQAPLFYDEIEILRTYNYNMAPWNLHERKIIKIEGQEVLLNDASKLVFYHFSKISEDESAVSREYNRFTLDELPLLKELYDGYKKALKESHFREYKKIPIAYPVKMNLKPTLVKRSVLSKVFRKIGDLTYKLSKKV